MGQAVPRSGVAGRIQNIDINSPPAGRLPQPFSSMHWTLAIFVVGRGENV
jgi:hypothetical protein